MSAAAQAASKRFAEGKALMPGGLIPPEQMKNRGPTRRLRCVGNKQQMIYKHAISTIIPEKPLDLTEAE